MSESFLELPIHVQIAGKRAYYVQSDSTSVTGFSSRLYCTHCDDRCFEFDLILLGKRLVEIKILLGIFCSDSLVGEMYQRVRVKDQRTLTRSRLYLMWFSPKPIALTSWRPARPIRPSGLGMSFSLFFFFFSSALLGDFFLFIAIIGHINYSIH